MLFYFSFIIVIVTMKYFLPIEREYLMNLSLIKNNVYYCGMKDKERRLFDELVPLPEGTTYNSYLVIGSEKTALIDTTYPPKIDAFISKLEDNGINNIDYIIANHGEQDHTGALPTLVKKYPNAKIVTNQKCRDIIKDMLDVSDDKFLIINDKEELSLGDKTLQFIMAPWVHWPDTMFTYIKEDNIIYTSWELFADNSKELECAAKRYYAEIMMPFRSFSAKYLKLVKEMNVEMILPSHGPVYNKPEFIFDLYTEWTKDSIDNLVVIPYVSMYESTKKMADHLTKKLEEKGIQVILFDTVGEDHGELAMHVVNAATVVLAASMVLAGPHPTMVTTAYLLSALRPKFKNLSIIGSYGWGGNLTGKLEDMFTLLKPEKLEYVIVKGCPKQDAYEKLDALAESIYQKHKELGLL